MFYGWDTDTVMFWGAIVVIVAVTSFFSHRTRAAKYRMLETLAEKGQQISPELLASIGGGNGRPARNAPQSGIILMCIGVAIAVFFWAVTGGGNPLAGSHNFWLGIAFGIFPFMIGLARVLGGVTEKRKDQ